MPSYAPRTSLVRDRICFGWYKSGYLGRDDRNGQAERHNDSLSRKDLYQILPAGEQWDAGMDGMKKLLFSDAAIDGRILYCTYSANNGMTRDTSTLTKAMPAGYICSLYKASNNKGRRFDCKRAVPPIKFPK